MQTQTQMVYQDYRVVAPGTPFHGKAGECVQEHTDTVALFINGIGQVVIPKNKVEYYAEIG